MLRFNWSCNQCGMSSGRRYSVERHIKTLHGGSGLAIPYEEYVLGRRTGNYIPKQRPRFRRFEDQIEHVIDEELRKKVIQTTVSEMMLNPSEAARITTIVRNILQRKTFRIQLDAVNNANRYIDSIFRGYY
jgi:hypothetical protein